jgi:hypothetical protein
MTEMSGRHLETLQLSPERVAGAVRFLGSYGDLCLREHAQLIDQLERPADLAYEMERSQQLWDLTVEAASSFCEAGQWAMLTDPPQALSLWRRAGQLYRQLDFGFGHYLLATTGEAEEPNGQLVSAIRAVARAGHVADHDPDIDERLPELPVLPEPLLHPQQQAYLMLAGATMASRHSDLRQPLSLLAQRSPHRRGVTPVGALGIPISTLWGVVDALMRLDPEALFLVARVIQDLSRRYDDAMRLAMVNQHLWRHAAAPVDVGSLDIAALTINAHRVFSQEYGSSTFLETLSHGTDDLPPLARSQVEIAMEMAQYAGGIERG